MLGLIYIWNSYDIIHSFRRGYYKVPFFIYFFYIKNLTTKYFQGINPARVDIYSPFVAAMPDENNMLISGSFCRFLCGFKSHLLQNKKKTVLSQFIAYRGSQIGFLFFIFSVSTAIC